jgi:hypothetical protein
MWKMLTCFQKVLRRVCELRLLLTSKRGFSLLIPEGITTIVFDNVPHFGVEWTVEQLPAGGEVTVTINSW